MLRNTIVFTRKDRFILLHHKNKYFQNQINNFWQILNFLVSTLKTFKHVEYLEYVNAGIFNLVGICYVSHIHAMYLRKISLPGIVSMAQPVTFLGGMLMTFSASHCPFCNPKKQLTYYPCYHDSCVVNLTRRKRLVHLPGP